MLKEIRLMDWGAMDTIEPYEIQFKAPLKPFDYCGEWGPVPMAAVFGKKTEDGGSYITAFKWLQTLLTRPLDAPIPEDALPKDNYYHIGLLFKSEGFRYGYSFYVNHGKIEEEYFRVNRKSLLNYSCLKSKSTIKGKEEAKRFSMENPQRPHLIELAKKGVKEASSFIDWVSKKLKILLDEDFSNRKFSKLDLLKSAFDWLEEAPYGKTLAIENMDEGIDISEITTLIERFRKISAKDKDANLIFSSSNPKLIDWKGFKWGELWFVYVWPDDGEYINNAEADRVWYGTSGRKPSDEFSDD